jgi:hypothetical protein
MNKLYDSVDVSLEEVTPITRQPIQKIKIAEENGRLELEDLYENLSIIRNRQMIAQEFGMESAVQAMEYAIQEIQRAIDAELSKVPA